MTAVWGNFTYPEHPCEPTDGSSQVRDDARLNSAEVGRQSRASIEAEPAEPKEDRAKDNVGGVMWLIRQTLSSVATALA